MTSRTKPILMLALLLMAVRLAQGQAYDAMRRSTNITGSDLLAVQTNSAGAAGQKFLTTITASNFLESLKLFPGWPSGLGTLTTVKTNGANVSTTAASINFVEGTNIVLRTTNAAGAVTVQINSVGGSGSGDVSTAQHLYVSNQVQVVSNTMLANDITSSNGAISAVAGTLKSYSTNIHTLPSIYTNIVYLNATGATTIINGTLLTNAMKTLPQFSVLWVGAGDYWNPTGTIPSMVAATDNRVIYFSPGAKWVVGNAAGDGAYMVDDLAGKVTNVTVSGYGTLISTNDITTADLFYTEAGSNIRIECNNALMYGGGAVLSWGGGVSNNVRLLVRETAMAGYDLIYGNGSDGTTLDAEIGYAEANGDMLETTDDSPQWGLINVHIKRAKSRSVSQPSAAIVSGRATLTVDDWEIARPASLYSMSTATNGLIIGGNWRWTGSITGGVVHAVANATTALKIKNANITWPGNFDPFYLTNGTGTEFCLENVSLTIGSGPTNLARGLTPSRMRVIGSLAVNRSLGLGANITLTGTNVMNSLTVLGSQTNAGTLNVAGATTIGGQFTGSAAKLTGILDVDSEVYANAAIFTNTLVVPYQAASGGVEGELVFDFDLFASGRGALKTFDGTADTVIVGVLASDSPSNGQVPKFNSASGTITWEDDSGSGGGEANVNGEISVTNATKIGWVYGKAGVTNLLRSSQAGNGIVKTNEGTNVVTAIDPAIIPTHTQLVTASNALVSYANGVTNASIVRQTEATALSNAVVAYANGVTNASIVRQTELTAESNALVTFTLARGTNFPPALNQLGSTNLDVSTGTRKVQTITTNASFALNLSGTPLNGSTFMLGISNYAASPIYLTTFVASASSSAFLPSQASNVTVFAVPATSIRWLEFLSETNFNLGTARWNIIRDQGKEMELTAGYAVTFATNSAGTLITNTVSAALQGLHANTATTVTNENSSALQINTGVLTLTPGVLSNLNASSISVPVANVVSNVGAIKFAIWTNYVQTVSNFVFSFATNHYELKNQTNVVFTNIVEELTGVAAPLEVHIHNTTGVTMGLVWPAYGAQHGYFLQTNANNPIISTTSLAAGQHGVASFKCFGTNIFATFTTWP